jgi:hypothetical protein
VGGDVGHAIGVILTPVCTRVQPRKVPH